MERVSVVIPVYGQWHLLKRNVDALLTYDQHRIAAETGHVPNALLEPAWADRISGVRIVPHRHQDRVVECARVSCAHFVGHQAEGLRQRDDQQQRGQRAEFKFATANGGDPLPDR